MRPCFKFTAKADGKPAVLAIDEEIGFWGVQAKDFRAALDSVKGQDIEVQINSVGGDVMAGLGMYNMLRSAADAGTKVTTKVTGIAASMASIVALAGDKREMPANAFAMIHAPAALLVGAFTADELRDQADVNDKIEASMRKIYVDRMGITEAQADELMTGDTWLTAQECKDMGFATDLIGEVQATAQFDLARADLPEHVASIFIPAEEEKPDEQKPAEQKPAEEPKPADPPVDPAPVKTPKKKGEATADEVVALAKEHGFEAHSARLAMSCGSVDAAKVRIAALVEIQALCAVAGKPEFLATAVDKDYDLDTARGELLKAMSDADTHTDGARKEQKASHQASGASGSTTDQIWDRRKTAQAKKKG